MHTWEEAIKSYKYPQLHGGDTYREGFRSGWLDASIGHVSMVAQTSGWGNYASGYQDGQISYHYYNPVVQEKGEITCLKNLLA